MILNLLAVIRKNLPNFITSLNLLSGSIGVTFAITGQIEQAAWCIGIAAVFDFLDGFVARLLKVKSDIGKELDSLADVISFGLLPGSILYKMMLLSTNLPVFEIANLNIIPFTAFIIPIFSALRLAKFNIDTRQAESFLGLPTPASALVFGSLPLILLHPRNLPAALPIASISGNFYFLLSMAVLVSALLVSEIPLFALKFKNLSWKSNQPQFILLGLSLLLLILVKFAALPLIIAAYILLSLLNKKK